MVEIDWKQNSTKRGAIWLVSGVIGAVFAWFGKDPSTIMLIASSVAGGVGVALKD